MDQVNNGHRKRMKERFEKYGLDNFQDHEVLEMLLFYAMPYQNTNGIAHRLLNKFGTFSRVFSASRSELMSIPGIGKHTAILIEFIPQLLRRYSIDLASEQVKYETKELLAEYVTNHFIGQTKEHVQLFLFDHSLRRIDSILLAEGTLGMVELNAEMVAQAVFANNAAYYVLAHNHPAGDTNPSYEDLCVTRKIYKTLSALNREMIEHYIVSDGQCRPILAKAKETFDKFD